MKKQNVFEYAATCELEFETMLEDCGIYRRKTTFYSDLSIAEYYGAKAVIDTYRKVMNEWLHNIEFITEFVLCLNHKSWEWHANGNDMMAQMYVSLCWKASMSVLEHFKDNDEALGYFYRVTD